MLRLSIICCLWLLAMSAWAVPVTLANSGSSTVAVYAHPTDNDAAIGQLPGGSQVDVLATDMTKGYLLIQYQGQQAWIQASSVVNTTNTSKADDSVQQVLNQAFSNAGTKVDVAVSTAQSKLTQSLTQTQLRQNVKAWTNKQAQTWFLTGALILLLGLIFGLLLGKMLWRPRRSFLR